MHDDMGEQLATRFDPESATLWMYMHPRPRPCFNPAFLTEFGALTRRVDEGRGTVAVAGRAPVLPVIEAVAQRAADQCPEYQPDQRHQVPQRGRRVAEQQPREGGDDPEDGAE